MIINTPFKQKKSEEKSSDHDCRKAALLYFCPVPPIQKKTTARVRPEPAASKVLRPVKAATRKRKTAIKQKKPFPAMLKIVLAALLLILSSPLYYGYILKIFISARQWVMDIGEDPHYRSYESYAIRIPKGYTIHGIDVSAYQGKIDWKLVRSMKEDEVKVDFAFIKATQGVSGVDPYFQRNWREAPKAGLICGAYHYFIPRKPGLWQARFFLQTVKFESGDLPPVVDVEELSGTEPAIMRRELKEFLDHIERKTTVRPIIYSGLSFYKDYLQGYFDGYPLWIAHYHQAELKVGVKTSWFFWQHSDRAKISGINHIVDFNVFRGDDRSFRQFLIR